MSHAFVPTHRTQVRRVAQRATYLRDDILGILDAGLVCHVGFVVDGHPFVIPTAYARIDDKLYLHGAVASRMLRAMRDGAPVCINVTLLDGLVLARSAFHHSMNYRSVVVVGTGIEVTEPAEKVAALRALVEHVSPGRWNQTRKPNRKELEATAVLRVPIEEASAKVRSGGPIDDAADYALPYWAGQIPLTLVRGEPIPD
jgi:hypothetical protein